MSKNMTRVGVIFLALTVTLSIMGVSYGLWTKSLTVEGMVRTGEVDLVFVDAFTDDDGEINDLNKDSQDDGGPSQGFDAWGSDSSADPSASGRDPKDHYDEDVAKCEASIDHDHQEAQIEKFDAYPSYFCTAWFDIRNVGTIPVKINDRHSNGQANSVARPAIREFSGFMATIQTDF